MGLFCSEHWLAGRDPAAIEPGDERLLIYDDSWGPLPEQAWVTPARAAAVAVRTNSTRSLVNMAAAGGGVAGLAAVRRRQDRCFPPAILVHPLPGSARRLRQAGAA